MCYIRGLSASAIPGRSCDGAADAAVLYETVESAGEVIDGSTAKHLGWVMAAIAPGGCAEAGFKSPELLSSS